MTKARSNATAPAAKGEIVVGTGSDVSGILGVGANNTVLTADSSTATGLKWATASAGGMTLLSTTTLSGTSTSITSISGSYTNLLVILSRVSLTQDDFVNVTFNSDTGSNYQFNSGNGSSLALSRSTNVDQISTASNNWTITVFRYANATHHKPLLVSAGYVSAATGGQVTYADGGTWRNNAALTSVQVFTTAGTTFDNGTVYIYGDS